MEAGQSSMNGTTCVLATGQASISKRLPSTTTGTSARRSEIKHSRKTILAWLRGCQLIEEGEPV
ncbi:hypothetical protein A2U01_0063784, partial [Trifolium medium]|nr:hypothetical protein [Trifolium medium]